MEKLPKLRNAPQLTNYLESESLLAEEQHGFRRDHSTVHSIAKLTNHINKKMDKRVATLAAFIDFRKAFDCVQHSVLMQKLSELILDENVHAWVKPILQTENNVSMLTISVPPISQYCRESRRGRF